MAKPGRPPGFGPLRSNPDLVNSVLERMANGEILTAICKQVGLTPGAFCHFANEDEAFAQRYARAREMQAAAIAEDVVRVIDDESDPERAQLAIGKSNARKWLASRLDPAKFGDKTRTELTGADGAPLMPSLNIALAVVAVQQPQIVETQDVDLPADVQRTNGAKLRKSLK